MISQLIGRDFLEIMTQIIPPLIILICGFGLMYIFEKQKHDKEN